MHEDPVPSVWKTWQGTRPGQGRDLTPMVLALGVGLCALPFVFILVTPRLGFRAVLLTALAVLAGVTVLCRASVRLPGVAGLGRGERRDVPDDPRVV